MPQEPKERSYFKTADGSGDSVFLELPGRVRTSADGVVAGGFQPLTVNLIESHIVHLFQQGLQKLPPDVATKAKGVFPIVGIVEQHGRKKNFSLVSGTTPIFGLLECAGRP